MDSMANLIEGCGWAGKMKAASADQPNAASMTDQTTLQTVGSLHQSRAIPTSVHVERAFIVKKD